MADRLPEPPRMPTVDRSQAHRWIVHQYQPATGDPIGEGGRAREQATALLRDLIRADGHVIVVESVAPTGEDLPVVVTSDDGDWRQAHPGETPSGRIVAWSACATQRHSAEPTLSPTLGGGDGGPVKFDLPAEVTTNGGSVRLVHGLGVPVTCHAYSVDGPVGYLFAVQIDDDVEVIELLPGTVAVVVEPDEVQGP